MLTGKEMLEIYDTVNMAIHGKTMSEIKRAHPIIASKHSLGILSMYIDVSPEYNVHNSEKRCQHDAPYAPARDTATACEEEGG